VTQPDSDSDTSNSSELCGLHFAAADGRFTAEVSLHLVYEADKERAQKQVDGSECNGLLQTSPSDAGAEALRQCLEQDADLVGVDSYAAGHGRFAHLTVKLQGSQQPATDVAANALDLSRRVLRRCLTLPAGD
jgi:hypothetical protein